MDSTKFYSIFTSSMFVVVTCQLRNVYSIRRQQTRFDCRGSSNCDCLLTELVSYSLGTDKQVDGTRQF